MQLKYNFSNLSNFDIGLKSLIFSHPSNFNSLIFLLFFKNEILDIFVSLRFSFSNLFNFDIELKSSIFLHPPKFNFLIFFLFSKNEICIIKI